MVVTVLFGGRLADYILTKNVLTVTTVRKLFNTVGFMGEAIFLFVCAMVDDQVLAIACLICSAGMSGFSLSGFNVNTLDIAPRYAGILMGFANGLANLSGMVAPTLIEHFTKTH
uniref:Uncharacterized protein n=1 Tax=Romanomermis culicivorax TaxID=13658 RepID=A0A915KL91_ROMCU